MLLKTPWSCEHISPKTIRNFDTRRQKLSPALIVAEVV
jgi:hypothetical protein